MAWIGARRRTSESTIHDASVSSVQIHATEMLKVPVMAIRLPATSSGSAIASRYTPTRGCRRMTEAIASPGMAAR